jgi:hypothetical protein
MKLNLKRKYRGPDYTIGSLYVNGTYFCDTLEDSVRDIPREGKIPGKTAIPAGEYKVILSHSPRFKRELPRLLNVPYFDGILIHRGNTPNHTEGCILIGENKIKGQVINSTQYELRIIELMRGATNRGEEITIKVE